MTCASSAASRSPATGRHGTTATGDATTRPTLRQTPGCASTVDAGSFILAPRLDAFWLDGRVTRYTRRGGSIPARPPSTRYSSAQVPGGCTGASGGNCGSALLVQTTAGPSTTALQDTDVNVNDFILFVDTNGTSAGAGQRLGAPGPQNLSSPISLDGYALAGAKLDACERRAIAEPGPRRHLRTRQQLDVRHARHPHTFTTTGWLPTRRGPDSWTSRSALPHPGPADLAATYVARLAGTSIGRPAAPGSRFPS